MPLIVAVAVAVNAHAHVYDNAHVVAPSGAVVLTLKLDWNAWERTLGTEPRRVALTARAVLASLLLYGLSYRTVAAWAARTETATDDRVIEVLRWPRTALLPLLALTASWPHGRPWPPC